MLGVVLELKKHLKDCLPFLLYISEGCTCFGGSVIAMCNDRHVLFISLPLAMRVE